MPKNQDDDDRNVTVYLMPFGWFTGWLFTIGFAHLSFGQGLIALVAWPAYLGSAVS